MARCGYNQDPMFYCTMWPGDKFLSDLISYQLKLLPGIWKKCSVASKGLEEGGCARILDSSELAAHRKTDKLNDDFLNLWPQVANNAPCVKDTITSGFWGFSTISQISSAILAVVALIA